MSKFNKRDIKTVREALNKGLSISLVQPDQVQDLHATGILDQPKTGPLPASADESRVLISTPQVLYYLVKDTGGKE